jgi:putative transposase
MREILLPLDKKEVSKVVQGRTLQVPARTPKNFYGEITLLCYCLMPNHFHLLVKQNSNKSIESFMRALITRYSIYFNKKHKRVGYVFQGRYKAVLVDNNNYMLHLSRYIHLNPSQLYKNLSSAYSSYKFYLEPVKKIKWLKTSEILSFFNQSKIPEIQKSLTYKNFIENYLDNSENILEGLTLE